MDTHANRPEDLNEVERRLSAWQPSRDGLDTDAVLFAAGRASVSPRPSRFLWPVLTTLLTALVVVLGVWLANERRERQDLARLLREHPYPNMNAPSPAPDANAATVDSPDADEPAPDSYLASRRALEKGLDAWPNRVVAHAGPPDPSLTEPPILRLGHRDALLEP